MGQYFCTPAFSLPANADQSVLLHNLQAASLPVVDVQTSGTYPGQVIVVTSADLTQPQQTTMNTTIAAWDPRPRVPRPLYLIYNDIAALSAGQQTNIWTDLVAGTPNKYLLDAGSNAAAVATFDWVVKKSGATGASLTDARLRIAAMYVQDNPKYLASPTFDPTINIVGDMPAP